MNCETVRKQMDLLVFDQIPVPDGELSAHLLTCPACRRYLEECLDANRILAALRRSEPRPDDPDQLTESIIGAVKAIVSSPGLPRSAVPMPHRRLVVLERLLAAASICLMLVFGVEQYTVVEKIARLEEQAGLAARSPGMIIPFQAMNTAGLTAVDIRKAIRLSGHSSTSSFGLLQKQLDKIGNP